MTGTQGDDRPRAAPRPLRTESSSPGELRADQQDVVVGGGGRGTTSVEGEPSALVDVTPDDEWAAPRTMCQERAQFDALSVVGGQLSAGVRSFRWAVHTSTPTGVVTHGHTRRSIPSCASSGRVAATGALVSTASPKRPRPPGRGAPH
jgi:hypothetical protein